MYVYGSVFIRVCLFMPFIQTLFFPIHFRPHSFHIIIIIRRINFLCSSSLAIVTFAHFIFFRYLPEAIRRRSSTHLHHWHKRTLEILISTILFVSIFPAMFLFFFFACEPQRVVTWWHSIWLKKKKWNLMQCNVNKTHLLKYGNRDSIPSPTKRRENTHQSAHKKTEQNWTCTNIWTFKKKNSKCNWNRMQKKRNVKEWFKWTQWHDINKLVP